MHASSPHQFLQCQCDILPPARVRRGNPLGASDPRTHPLDRHRRPLAAHGDWTDLFSTHKAARRAPRSAHAHNRDQDALDNDKLACPALLCSEAADNAVPIAWTDVAVNGWPSATLRRIGGVGHSALSGPPGPTSGAGAARSIAHLTHPARTAAADAPAPAPDSPAPRAAPPRAGSVAPPSPTPPAPRTGTAHENARRLGRAGRGRRG